METLETLTQRIETTKDLQSLARSMKTLSAINVRQFEKAEASLRLFRQTIDQGLQIVLKQHPPRTTTGTHHGARQALVVFGSDRGLCGNFNETVVELTQRHLARGHLSAEEMHILPVGNLVGIRLERLGIEIDATMPLAGSVQGISDCCERILIRLDTLLKIRNVQWISTIFNRRDEKGEIGPRAHVLMPLRIDHLKSLQRKPWPSRRLSTFSAPPDALFSWLVRQSLLADLYDAALASLAAENAARLQAMQRAERSINDKLDEMTADFRRLRQDAITMELMDIVSGYEILRSRPM